MCMLISNPSFLVNQSDNIRRKKQLFFFRGKILYIFFWIHEFTRYKRVLLIKIYVLSLTFHFRMFWILIPLSVLFSSINDSLGKSIDSRDGKKQLLN